MTNLKLSLAGLEKSMVYLIEEFAYCEDSNRHRELTVNLMKLLEIEANLNKLAETKQREILVLNHEE